MALLGVSSHTVLTHFYNSLNPLAQTYHRISH